MSEYHTPVMLDESVSASLSIPTAFTPMPPSEAVATPPNFFHAYTMARASSPSIVTGTPCAMRRTTDV